MSHWRTLQFPPLSPPCPLATVAIPTRLNSHPLGFAPGCCVHVLVCPIDALYNSRLYDPDARYDSCPHVRCRLGFTLHAMSTPVGIPVRMPLRPHWNLRPHTRWVLLQLAPGCPVGARCNSYSWPVGARYNSRPHAALAPIGICIRMSP